jgi:hypothetical protein
VDESYLFPPGVFDEDEFDDDYGDEFGDLASAAMMSSTSSMRAPRASAPMMSPALKLSQGGGSSSSGSREVSGPLLR